MEHLHSHHQPQHQDVKMGNANSHVLDNIVQGSNCKFLPLPLLGLIGAARDCLTPRLTVFLSMF